MHSSLQSYFSKYRLDALLISNLVNVRYLSGFTGTNGTVLVIPSNRNYFFTDFRYREQSAKEVKGFKIIESHRDIGRAIVDFLRKHKIKKLGFEAVATNYSQFLRLKKSLRGIKLIPVTEDPGKLREIKTEIEIKKIAKALAINKLAFEEVRRLIKPGVSEMKIKTLLEIAMLKHGADKIAFDTIIASGWRGALPHGVASNKKIRAGELVTVDFGCVVDGYNSDETVTVLVGEAKSPLSPLLFGRRGRANRLLPFQQGEGRERSRSLWVRKQLAIHQIVYDAQQYAVQAARPGAKCSDIDKAARDYITQKGYGKYFGHALGHGVGLEVHERPVLSPNSTDILEEGMVFTIEPGIYIPKFGLPRLPSHGKAGGVRIEDVFVCTKSGVRKVSRIEKKLE